MKFLKIAVLPVILLSVLMMGGCVTTGPETTITGFQKVSSFENKKVSLSLPVVVEKDMETKKNPDTTEKSVADEVYTKLKENLNQKGLLSLHKNNSMLNIELRVHFVDEYFGSYKYFGIFSNRNVGGQIIMIQAIIKKDKETIFAQVNSFDNTVNRIDFRKPMIQRISIEVSNQIEKILKEGVNVGKSP